MVWAPKAGTEPSFSLGQAFAALVAGDPSLSWLAQYIPLVQDIQFQTAALCAAGPPPDPDVSGSFLQWDGVSPITPQDLVMSQSVLMLLELGKKIQQVAVARVFGAYCENLDAGSSDPDDFTWTPEVCAAWVCPAGGNSSGFVNVAVVPAGATRFRVTLRTYDPIGGVNGKFIDVGASEPVPWAYRFDSAYWTGAADTREFDAVPGYHMGFSSGGNAAGDTVNVCYSFLASPTSDYNPTPQPEPDNYIPREVKDYPDLDAVGKELDAQELKLDVILAFLMSSNLIIPRVGPQATGETITASPVEQISLLGYSGIVCTATLISPSVDMVFGTPATYGGLGQLVFGAKGGFGPVVNIDCNPFVLAEFPADAETVTVQYFAPSTGTFRLIPKVG